VYRAVCADSGALKFASPRLLQNQEIVERAFESWDYPHYPHPLCYVSKNLIGKDDIVSKALEQEGLVLEFATDNQRSNKGIVSIAVQENGLALQFASPDLRDDEDIVRIAIDQTPLALFYASDALKKSMVKIKTLCRERLK